MKPVYSLYEAKAKLSAIVRRVREGATITVTVHGKPVAEIRPIAPEKEGLLSRLATLEERGELIVARKPFALRTLATRKGAVKRFLAERD